MTPAATSLTKRLVAALVSGPPAFVAVGAVSAFAFVACVPAANAPLAPGEPPPAGTTKPVSAPLGPAVKGNPTKEELCAGHACPDGTYCDSDMTPRGPVAQCKPQITQVPGRRFETSAPLLTKAWA